MSHLPRRTLLQAAALGAVASRLPAANDRVHLAVIGLGGRGRDHMTEYAKLPEARIVAVCDVDQAARERAVAQVQRLTGETPKAYTDMREVFDDKSVDAVSMPLPNHWHALSTIWACQAGKDVYVEKPASHNVFEGQKMIEAARKYGRMVQVGSQSRSIPHKMEAVKLVQGGAIGKVYLAQGLCYKRRKTIGRKPDGPVPAGVDWDKFLGPAPLRPFNANRFLYNWHWFWDTGNGDIGNQGVHEMDIALWGLGRTTLPASVVSTGGKFVYDDDQETPNTQVASFNYGDAEIVFEVRGLPTGGVDGLPPRGTNTVGNVFYGGDGFLAVDDDGYRLFLGEKRELAKDVKRSPGSNNGYHMGNFLQAVKSRRYQDLNAEIEIGARAAALCHLANISYRVGRKLAVDAEAKRFVGDDEANRLLTRPYRAPYVVPEKV